MKSSWSAPLFFFLIFGIIFSLSGHHFFILWQPLEFLLAATVYFVFYTSSFGLALPSTVPALEIRKVAFEGFYPSVLINLGLGLSHLALLSDLEPDAMRLLAASVAITTTYPVFILIFMISLGAPPKDSRR